MAPALATLGAESSPVPGSVANQGHHPIVEGRAHYLALLAFLLYRRPVFPEQFDKAVFRKYVIHIVQFASPGEHYVLTVSHPQEHPAAVKMFGEDLLLTINIFRTNQKRPE